MRLIIQPDYEALSQWAAYYVASKINSANPTEKRPFVLGLPTGSTPLGMYRHLIELNRQGLVSFKHVVTFNMDEYVGLPVDHPQSYHLFMRDNFFSHIDINFANVNIPNGNAPDLALECENYERKIDDAGGIDLFVGGIGAYGHLAFNEPGSSLFSETRIKTLTTGTLIANSRFFDNDPEKVPKTAITVGLSTIMLSHEVLLLANGHGKARALAQGVEGPVSQMWPVTALQLYQNGIILCDEAAADELKVKTYRYFKDIEKDNLDYRNLLK